MAVVTRVVTKTSIDLLVVKVERAKMDNGTLNHRLLLPSLKFKVMQRGYGFRAVLVFREAVVQILRRS
jgi:hypothetical protein